MIVIEVFWKKKKNFQKILNINNNQLILKGLIIAMPQLTERNQLM